MNALKCKPGDLAIMTFTINPKTAPNRGRIVEVISAYGEREYPIGTLFMWVVRPVGDGCVNQNDEPTKEGLYPDAYLTPINPPPLSALTDTRQFEGVEA